MEQQFTMTRDIVEEHKNRMMHLRKYYPFFKIIDSSLHLYKEGKYQQLDMGYITLAILRFFMEENNFQQKEVTYAQYQEFMKTLLVKDFHMVLEEQEEKELISFIFEKIRNEGKPFLFPYYDPQEQKQLVMRVKLLEGHITGETVVYSITGEAIEFYLETKEFKDRNTITVEQLLLEKMIQSRNFKGGTRVVQRINREVQRLMAKKNEVLGILSVDVFQGLEAYEEFMEKGTRWFKEEEKLFQKNSELIHMALKKARQEQLPAMEEIYQLENEIRQAMVRHGNLLQACTELQKVADEMVYQSKLHALRPIVDFRKMLHQMMEQDEADKLQYFILPLCKLNIRKTFSLHMLDEMLTYRPDKEETGEKIIEEKEETYIFEDEIEDDRIRNNFWQFGKMILDWVMQKGSLTLEEIMQSGAWECVWNNHDFYTFLVHLCQKQEYDLKQVREEPDTFLEEILSQELKKEENQKYNELHIVLHMLPDEEIRKDEMGEWSNLKIELV